MTARPLHSLEAVTIAEEVRTGLRTAGDVIEATLARITNLDPSLNCFTAVLADRARVTAARVDASVAAGCEVGALAGVPFAVKNIFDIAGMSTIAGSKILRDASPATCDANAITRLEAAGAILVGALNMDEFAYGFSTENAHYGATRNPHDLERIAGGSSGGSAAAVAAGLVPLALGTDTNGSVRVPASLCGVFGLKPSFARLSRSGVFPFVECLDHVGLFARSVRDLAVAYDILQGPDHEDPHLTGREPDLAGSMLDKPTEDLRIGVLGGWFAGPTTSSVKTAVDQIANALGSIGRIELPYSDVARAAAFCMTAAEGGALHLPRLRTRAADFDPATRSRLIAGAMLPASLVTKARAIQRDYARSADEVFDKVDILLAPATPCSAPLLNEAAIVIDGEPVPVRANLGLYTQPLSFAGLPVVVVPLHADGEMPVGVQIIASRWREDLALTVAATLEGLHLARAPVAPGAVTKAAA